MNQSELVFELTCGDPKWSTLKYDASPKLSVFFPVGSDCRQLNYGQGEGQVLIDGNEWGFYFNDRGNIDVMLHEGDLPIEEAREVVSRICSQLRVKMGVDVRFELKVQPERRD